MAGTHRGFQYSQASSRTALSRCCSLCSQSSQCQLILGSRLYSKASMASVSRMASRHRFCTSMQTTPQCTPALQLMHRLSWTAVSPYTLTRPKPGCNAASLLFFFLFFFEEQALHVSLACQLQQYQPADIGNLWDWGIHSTTLHGGSCFALASDTNVHDEHVRWA